MALSIPSRVSCSYDLESNARRLLAVYYLAKFNTPSIAAQELYKDKICGDPPTTQQLLVHLQEYLHTIQLDFNNFRTPDLGFII